MLSYPPRRCRSRFTALLNTFANDPGLPFDQALPEATIEQAAADFHLDFAHGPDDIYTPAITLWAFVAQVLSAGKSCVTAVARVMVLRLTLGLPACSAHTGGYCKARAKLPEGFLRQLTYQVGEAVEDQAPDAWRWRGRRVLLADGCEVTAADTQANQKEYPQPSTQATGVGFPMLRLVVLLTFATASLVGAAVGPHEGKESGETALFRQLLDRLRPRDVVVADRYYCSYWMVALLLEQGVAVVFRLHQRRDYDFRRGRRLGPGDHLVVWHKPQCPDWMDADTYARLPAQLTVREVRFRVTVPGYRPEAIVAATTLCAADDYPKEDIADLYHHRWLVELDIRSIKQTLKMEHLVCKTPAMVRRELWAHLLGYNLVRKVLAQAAALRGWSPRQLSFAGAVQLLGEFRWLLLGGTAAARRTACRALLVAIGSHEVGDRPGRCEPRRVKRRPKQYRRLTQPREAARAASMRTHGEVDRR
jgi:putative transposase